MKTYIFGKIKGFFISFFQRARPFYYDRKTLNYKRLDGWFIVIMISFCSVSFTAGWIFSSKNEIKKRNQYNEEEKLMFIKRGDNFSEEKMILFIKELNFRFPELVYAQGVLESGADFDSDLNIENNNYFGMKDANKRINIQSGTQNDYAYYTNWRNSVIDFALFAATYLREFETKEENYQYIERHYSETPGYIERVKKLEQQYFDKLSKIEAKSSYDILDLNNNDSLRFKKKKVKSSNNAITIPDSTSKPDTL